MWILNRIDDLRGLSCSILAAASASALLVTGCSGSSGGSSSTSATDAATSSDTGSASDTGAVPDTAATPPDAATQDTAPPAADASATTDAASADTGTTATTCTGVVCPAKPPACSNAQTLVKYGAGTCQIVNGSDGQPAATCVYPETSADCPTALAAQTPQARLLRCQRRRQHLGPRHPVRAGQQHV